MKKILTIALVALLAASTAFAASITGNATVKLGYDTTSKEYGFKNGTGVTANIELASETVENVAEGDVYAGIKATMKLAVVPVQQDADDGSYKVDTNLFKDGQALGLWLSVKEAYIAGADWKLSIKGTSSAPDYAESAIDGSEEKYVKDDFGNYYDYLWVPTSYAVSAWNKAGLTLSYKGYTVAGGFYGCAKEDAKYFDFNAFVETKAFEFEGGSAQAAFIVANKEAKSEEINLGFSAKANYAVDELSLDLASDFGVENLKDAKVNFDVAARVAYDFVALDSYYLYGDKLLSAKLSAAYEDVSGYVQMANILVEDSRALKVGATGTIDAVTLSGNVGLTLKSKAFTANASAKYVAEKYTLNGGVSFGITFGTEKSTLLSATASVSSDVVIPGATLSLAYGKDSDGNTMNFLKDQTNSKAQNFGAVTATCKIAF